MVDASLTVEFHQEGFPGLLAHIGRARGADVPLDIGGYFEGDVHAARPIHLASVRKVAISIMVARVA